MSLRFIYGRAGSGKSRFCLDEIKKALEAGGDNPLVLIVPEQFSLQAERNLIMATGREGTIRAEVLSFRRIAYRVFNETGGRVRRSINQAGKNMILSRITENRADEMKAFGMAARQKGFVKTLSDMITEFRRYAVTPERLKDMTQNMDAGAHDLLMDKLHDLGMVYGDFEDFIAGRFADSDDDLTLLCEKIERSEHFKNAEIWIDEFSGFTPQEYAVVKKLLTIAGRVNITLCTDYLAVEGETTADLLFAPVRNTASRLTRLASETGAEFEKPLHLTRSRRFPDGSGLEHLEKNIFTYPYTRFHGSVGDIFILAASNMFAEVEDAAREIIALCRDRNYRYRDIAVTSRNMEGYEKVVRTVFHEHGIPFFIDNKKDIMSNPVVIFILSALEIIKSNWSYEPVFRYLKTGLTGLGREQTDMLENYVLANGIRGSRWDRPEAWDFRPDCGFSGSDAAEREAEYLERINSCRMIVAEPLMNFHAAMKASRKPEDVCAALYDLMVSNGIKDKIEMLAEGFTTAGEISKANEYRQVWEAVMELLDQLVEVSENCPMDAGSFGKLLESGLEEYSVGLVPASLDQVLVGSVERSKSHEIKALFVLGLNDGVFPAAAMEEGILSDTERNRLSGAGMELAKDSRSRAYEERLLVYTTLTTSSDYLRLSWPAADMDGKAMRPSRIVSDIKRIFPDIMVRSNISGNAEGFNDKELIAAALPAFNGLIAAARKRHDGEQTDPVWEKVFSWFNGHEPWKGQTDRILSGLGHTGGISPVAREKAQKLYGNPLYSSVSRLETYSACPFSYFVQYGLKAGERSIFSWKPVDVGTFMHNVMEEFSKMLAAEGVSWRELERDWCYGKVSDIVDGMLDGMAGSVFNSSKRYTWLTSRLKNVITRSVMLTAEHFKRSNFDPYRYEADFREDGKFPPITIELPSGETMRLTGRIDRIDKYSDEEGTYLRIVDYKSGNKALKLVDVYYGLQLQLLTYMDAVLGEGDSGLLPGGVLYFRLDDPVIRGERTLTEEDIEKGIMKELRMKGLLLADVKLIRAMDRDLTGDSFIIPARINKGDILGRSSAATMEQFGLIRSHIKKTLTALGTEIVRGNVAASPYKKRTATACTWCEYSAVCQFDLTLKDNKYRVLSDMDDDQVWNKMRDANASATGDAGATANAGANGTGMEVAADGKE